MVNNYDITKFCQEYLETDKFEDYCHNGMQVEGKEEVKKIVTGVTYSRAFIEEAIKRGADMMLVHHGIFMKAFGDKIEIKDFIRQRLKLTLENDLNLLGFHLPLDAHPEIGNNISICKNLGLVNMQKCDVGFVGDIETEMKLADFVEYVNHTLETKSILVEGGPAKVNRIGVVSGGSSPDYLHASRLGADTFICGDIRENIVREAEESNINIINAGHYNTEKLGIENLGKLVAEKFGVEVEFVDVPNKI